MSAVQGGAGEPMPVSRIITGGYGSDLGPGAHCRVTRVSLQLRHAMLASESAERQRALDDIVAKRRQLDDLLATLISGTKSRSKS